MCGTVVPEPEQKSQRIKGFNLRLYRTIWGFHRVHTQISTVYCKFDYKELHWPLTDIGSPEDPLGSSPGDSLSSTNIRGSNKVCSPFKLST